MRLRASLLLMLAFTLFLSACGFHLRGNEGMPFKTLYIDAFNPSSRLISDLRRKLEAKKIVLVSSAEQAEVVLNIVSEVSNTQILTLSGSGRVSEFQLNYGVSLRAYDLKQQDWLRAEEIAMHRNYSYEDTQILAKGAEEALLYKNMRVDMVQQIIRRLSRAKPQPR